MTEEFNPKHFLADTPTHDSSGMEIPAWKRHIMARQIAEKAQVEAEANKKVSIACNQMKRIRQARMPSILNVI